MSDLSWLSNKEFAQLLATNGQTPELCAEAASRFEALADFEAGWTDFEYEYASPEEVKQVIAGLEEELSVEEKAHEETRGLYDDATNEVERLQERIDELETELAGLRAED